MMALRYQKLKDKTYTIELVNDATECFKQIESVVRISMDRIWIQLKYYITYISRKYVT
ncbi:MAG: hypothetical protein HQ562_04975 [Candidatus Marinimicrobia bacterium]|nr:hypothetical protein [Candidatus Neomarinimicrobiota bacterium]